LVNSDLVVCVPNKAQYHGYKYALIYWHVKTKHREIAFKTAIAISHGN